MPTYEYTCKKHGSFTSNASITDFDHPQDCPVCGIASPRNLLSTPQISFNGGKRPAAQKEGKGVTVKHHAGCSCCS
jgi:putative FmdB family regulatory protein